MKKNQIKNNCKYRQFIVATVVAIFFVFAGSVFAYSRYAPSEAVTIGDFLYNDDYTVSVADCYVTIWNPSGGIVVNNSIMTADANGWHHYTFAGSTTQGTWPATMTCGTAGVDLISQDKTFEISNKLASDVADSVWNDSTRTLTSGTSIAADIWAATTRQLTSIGDLAADIWNNTFAPTRSLTTKSLGAGGNLATEAYLDSMKTDIINQVDANETLINALNDISAADVWAYGTRGLTESVNLSTASQEDIWKVAKTQITTTGSIGKHLIDTLDANVSTRSTLTAADVWSNATRSLTDYATSSVALAVWANATKELTDYGNDITAADVWNVLSSNLTLQDSIGKQLATNVDATTSSRASQASITALNNISASDVWSYSNRSITDPAAVWDYALTSIGTSGTIGKLLKDNINATISSRSSHTAADIWSVVTRTLTSNANFNDPDSATIAAAVWANANRELTDYGNDITAADVWNVLSSNLTTDGTIGKQLATNVDVATSSRSTLTANDVWTASNRSLTTFGTLIADIWGYSGGRSLSTFGTLVADVWNNSQRELTRNGNDITAADVWNVLSSSLTTNGSIGKQLSVNVDATTSSRSTLTANDVWTAANRSLTSFGTLVADIWNNTTRTLTESGGVDTAAIADAVWSNVTRSLTDYGNDITAGDVWNTVGQVTQSGSSGFWVASMTDVDQLLAGSQYRVKVYTTNNGQPGNSFAAPLVTIYDVNRNAVVSNVSMTNIGTGVYEYVYSVSSGAPQGMWETVATAQVVSGQNITNSDYWEVRGSPAQVIINSISDNIIPVVAANVLITNEGSGGYEYSYEWCVVTDVNNSCGGSDDVFYASAAKYIQSGEDWNTTLNADVSTIGDYYFKLVVYFGTDSSGASRSFTAVIDNSQTYCGDNVCNGSEKCGTCPSDCGQCGGSGNGIGGGGGGGGGTPPPVVPVTKTCNGADFNGDKKVNSVDFSILLSFWKTNHPFKNPCVDMNGDKKVNSVDFSILLYQWNTKR